MFGIQINEIFILTILMFLLNKQIFHLQAFYKATIFKFFL